jgi:hypothetical protein
VRDGIGSVGGPVDQLPFFPAALPKPDLEGWPSVFDTYVASAAGLRLSRPSTAANFSPELGQFLQKLAIFVGNGARAANRGEPPRLAPADMSHLDPAVFAGRAAEALMTPAAGGGQAYHTIGPVTRGILTDLGWQLLPGTER